MPVENIENLGFRTGWSVKFVKTMILGALLHFKNITCSTWEIKRVGILIKLLEKGVTILWFLFIPISVIYLYLSWIKFTRDCLVNALIIQHFLFKFCSNNAPYDRISYREENVKTPWGRSRSYAGDGPIFLPTEHRPKCEPPPVLQRTHQHFGSGLFPHPRWVQCSKLLLTA